MAGLNYNYIFYNTLLVVTRIIFCPKQLLICNKAVLLNKFPDCFRTSQKVLWPVKQSGLISFPINPENIWQFVGQIKKKASVFNH